MQLAPELSEDILRRLVAAFQDLRMGYDQGTLTYPYSLRGQLYFLHSMFATQLTLDTQS